MTDEQPSKEIKEESVKIDQFGFFTKKSSCDPHLSLQHSTITSLKKEKGQIKADNRRTEKWINMLQEENWSVYLTGKKRNTLKNRCRKGIPDALRGKAWFQLTGANALKKDKPNVYNELLGIKEAKWEEQIVLDVDRTFPNHIMFQKIGGIGQLQLLRILRAYSLYDEEVGYCQGISYIAGFLLTYMIEENVFWMLVALMRNERYHLYDTYISGMPKALKTMSTMDVLINKKLKKAISNHFKKLSIQTPMYMTGWIMTLFTSDFPFEYVVRIFDAFTSEGYKIIYRIILTLLKEAGKNVIQFNFEDTIKYLQKTPFIVRELFVNPNQLMIQSFSIRLKAMEIQRIEENYEMKR
jgi:hypothetical protein